MNYIELIRSGQENKFYKLQLWRRCRAKALERDNNECQHCKVNKRDRVVKATHVHHIKEVKTHPHLALELSNLISLCFNCHEVIHARAEGMSKKCAFINEERW